jgi:hypothetical protein
MLLRRKQSPWSRALAGSRHLGTVAKGPARVVARPGLLAAGAVAGLAAASSAVSTLRKSHGQ